MKTQMKKLSETKVELVITLGVAELKTAEEKALKLLAKNMKVAGFRKGKVPIEVAKKQLHPNQITEEALDLAVRDSVFLAFEQEKKLPLLAPEIEVLKYVPGEELEYKATVEVLPEIKLGDFRNLKVKQPENKIKKSEVEEVLENIRKAYAEKTAVKREAKLGDEVVIDFVGKKDGVAFDGGSAKNFNLGLGSGQFIPGFEDGLVGKSAGEKIELDLTFPKDYHNADLAGAKTVFEVLVKQVNEVKKPELDDELAKKCGPFKTMTELEADIEKNLSAQKQYQLDEKYKDDLVAELVRVSKVAAPEILIKDQIRLIRDDFSRNAGAQEISLEDYLAQSGKKLEEFEKEAREVAEERVKASLVLQVLAKQEKLTVGEDTVEAKINELERVYQKSEEAMKNLKRPEVRQDIRNRLLVEKALELLVSENKK